MIEAVIAFGKDEYFALIFVSILIYFLFLAASLLRSFFLIKGNGDLVFWGRVLSLWRIFLQLFLPFRKS